MPVTTTYYGRLTAFRAHPTRAQREYSLRPSDLYIGTLHCIPPIPHCFPTRLIIRVPLFRVIFYALSGGSAPPLNLYSADTKFHGVLALHARCAYDRLVELQSACVGLNMSMFLSFN